MICPHGIPAAICGRCEPDPVDVKPFAVYTEELTLDMALRDAQLAAAGGAWGDQEPAPMPPLMPVEFVVTGDRLNF